MITGVDHTSFVVADMDRSVRFYTELLGCELDWRADRDTLPALRAQVGFPDAVLTVAQLRCPGGAHRIELLQYHRPAAPGDAVPRNRVGAAHLCFSVADIHAEVRRLSEAGVEFVSPPQWYDDGDGGHAVYFLDPDGVTVELTEIS